MYLEVTNFPTANDSRCGLCSVCFSEAVGTITSKFEGAFFLGSSPFSLGLSSPLSTFSPHHFLWV